ncbi:MAG: hypothetical protein IJY05_02875 [Clostridia bacterium]|nr:hypothetical protein [Clostridia bacterium]
MKIKKLIPLILTSAACFVLSFAFIGFGTKNAVADTTTTGDTSLSSFEMYNGSQIRLPVNSGDREYDASLRFMALIEQADYEAFEAAYGEDATTDTTEWGIVFATRSKVEQYDLNAANVFGSGGERVYCWNADTTATWETDSIGTTAPTGTALTMFTPVRYDNLDGLSLGSNGKSLINSNLSVDGQTGKAYYIISGAVAVPQSQYATEIVGRAYVRYVDENGDVQYKFADYASGYMDNNARSMTYVAQKYLESDEGLADEEKVYVDDSETQASHGQNNQVSHYIDTSKTVEYTIEYHFVDADGKSIVYSVESDGSTYTIDSSIALSAFEIIQMCTSTDLLAIKNSYGSDIDWYNPYKIDVAKAYANDRTIFKLYYANEIYANGVKDTYDVLAKMSKDDLVGSVVSWYNDGTSSGKEDLSDAQFDKTYTLGDDTYTKTVCSEHDADTCEHFCDAKKCSNPYHGHCSQVVHTLLNNNTLLVNATLWNSSLNNGAGAWDYMTFDENGNWVSGLNFADYEYLLLRFYSSIGGISMSIIAGSDESGNTVTTGVKYEIQQGWNRILIDSAMLQDVINAYAKTDGAILIDDVANGKIGIHAPYRNQQYIQFLVDDDSYYGTTSTPSSFDNWTMYFEDVIGVKARTETTVMEDYETTATVSAEQFTASINTDAAYVTDGAKSLQLTVSEDAEYPSFKVELKKDGLPLTMTQLSQTEIFLDVYAPCEFTLWSAGVTWTDAMTVQVNAWNTVRINGWRLVQGIEKFSTSTTWYDATTGELLLKFGPCSTVSSYASGTTFYIDNVRAKWLTSSTNETELDDLVALPGRTDNLETVEIINNSWCVHGGAAVDQISVKTDITTQHLWYPVSGASGYQYIINNDGVIRTDILYIEAGGYYCIPANLMYEGDSIKVRAYKEISSGNYIFGDWATLVGTAWWDYLDVNEANAGNRLGTPTVSISASGLATWSAISGATGGYEYCINNTTTYTATGRFVRLNEGDTISVRAATGTMNASAWSKPIMYTGVASATLVDEKVEYTDESGNATSATVETGKNVYDIAVADASIFSEAVRIASPVSGGGYAWRLTKNTLESSGYVMIPLTIGGQPLTNAQLLAIDYVELLVYAGENNNASGYIQFNAATPIVSECTLLPGQWNSIRVAGSEIYRLVQQYYALSLAEQRATVCPYNNGTSIYDGSDLDRLCGYANFYIGNANASDYWIIDGAKIVYSENPVYSTNASYWFTQHDYATMPIAAYNALPPTSDMFKDSLTDLSNKVTESKAALDADPNNAEKQNAYNNYLASYNSIKALSDSLAQYDTLDDVNPTTGLTAYDKLISLYVDCGINTMMGLYDYANYSANGKAHVISMLEKCAQKDLAYLLAWMGTATQTDELLESSDAARMKEWLIEYASYAAMAGVMIADEPGALMFDNYKAARESFEQYWGEDKLYHSNLLPNWAGTDKWLNFKNDGLEEDNWTDANYTYEDYINDYIEIYQPQMLSFDFYPMVGTTGTSYLQSGYFNNLATIRAAAVKANIPFWSYIQTSTWEANQRTVTAAELLWNVNTSLAYGAKGIQYFCGVEPYDEKDSAGNTTRTFTSGLFNADGSSTDIYYYAQKANMQILTVDHILMNARSMGVMYAGSIPQFYSVSNGVYTALDETANAAEIPTEGTLSSYGGATIKADGGVLVGCFDYNGKAAYYIVNNSTSATADANLVFGVSAYSHTGTLYGMESSSAWLSTVFENAGATTVPEGATMVSSAVAGLNVTTDSWDRLFVNDLQPGEAVLFVLD